MKKALIAQNIVKYIPLAACAILGLMYLVCALVEGYDLAIGFKVIISNATLVALVATGATFIFSA